MQSGYVRRHKRTNNMQLNSKKGIIGRSAEHSNMPLAILRITNIRINNITTILYTTKSSIRTVLSQFL